ncbi:UNVERIFIED_ORG: putative SOS response-associated peptidase YedK [Rhizobium nepotum]|nr:putative SOS response-associated peptidase YedK [Rhizobium nepotum]
MWKLIPGWLKIGVAAAAVTALLSAASFQVGKREGKSVAQIEAAKAALDRINTLEKNNASFRNMSDRHRCLIFMRDSGLPDSACD